MSFLFFCLGCLETQRTLFSLIVETFLNLAFQNMTPTFLLRLYYLCLVFGKLINYLGVSCFIIAMHFKVSHTNLHLEMVQEETFVFFSRVFPRHHMVWELIKREWRQRKRSLK